MKSRLLRVFVVSVFMPCFLSACSVGMAIEGITPPDLRLVKQGESRAQIEKVLGNPVRTQPTVHAGSVDTYTYIVGDRPHVGRAVMHLVLDIVTLGLWEFYGTPIELAQGTKKRLEVEYDSADTAILIRKGESSSVLAPDSLE